jgi:hypothetical protein
MDLPEVHWAQTGAQNEQRTEGPVSKVPCFPIYCGAEGRTRTDTGVKAQRFLSSELVNLTEPI